MEKSYTNLKKLSDKHGEIEFQAEIPLDVLQEKMGAALARSAENFDMPGFRKGKVPEHMIRERVDEMELLETAADEALRTAARDIIADEKISIIGSPELTITKIAIKNPVAFRIRYAIFPEIKLPDYQAIGKKISERADMVAVTDAEMNGSIERLLGMMGTQAPANPGADPAEAPKTTVQLTDDIVKKFGKFENVDDFKKQLKEQLQKEKEVGVKEAKREEIMREVVKGAKAELPALLIDQEWRVFEQERDEQLKQAGLTLEEYLKQAKKSEKDLEKEERALIEERVKTSLVFREIQKVENITAAEKEIQTNIAYLKLRYPDRGESWLRQTAEAVIIQEKVFDVLGLPIGGVQEAK